MTTRAIPRADKPRMIAELEAEIVELELQECLLIEAAQAAGMDVSYRANAHPLALLGLVPMRPRQPQPEEVLQAAE
jgi:hypothetical protein